MTGLYRARALEAYRFRNYGRTLPESRRSSIARYLFGLMLVSAAIGALFMPFGEKVNGHGYLYPDLGMTPVFSEIAGRVAAVNTKGGPVSRGDPLFVVANHRNTSHRGETDALLSQKKAEQLTLQLEKNRLEESALGALIQAREEERALELAKLQRYEEKITRLEGLYQAHSGFINEVESIPVSKLETYEQFFRQSNLDSEIITMKGRRAESRAELSSISSEVDDLRYRISVLEKERALLKNAHELEKIDREESTSHSVIAPRGGIIPNRSLDVGDKVESNETLYYIVPSDYNLVAVLFFPSSEFSGQNGDDIQLTLSLKGGRTQRLQGSILRVSDVLYSVDDYRRSLGEGELHVRVEVAFDAEGGELDEQISALRIGTPVVGEVLQERQLFISYIFGGS